MGQLTINRTEMTSFFTSRLRQSLAFKEYRRAAHQMPLESMDTQFCDGTGIQEREEL
jgi:hypothetical protein